MSAPEPVAFVDVLHAEYERLGVKPSGCTAQALRQAAHEHEHGLAAVCLSGGGIRSAALSLGVLQAIHKSKALHHFHYLSTVSGGGFCGGWVTNAIHKHKTDEIDEALDRALDEPAVREFRAAGRYLGQRGAVMPLALEYLRALGFNLIAIIPMLVFVLAVPRLVFALVHLIPLPSATTLTRILPPWLTVGWLSVLLVGAFVAVPVVAVMRRKQRGWSPIDATVASAIADVGVVVSISVVAIGGPQLLAEVLPSTVELLGGLTLTGGVSGALIAIARFSLDNRDSLASPKLVGLLMPVVAACFVLSVLLGLSVALEAISQGKWLIDLIITAIAGVVGIAVPWVYGPNDTSLHHLFENRLKTAFVTDNPPLHELEHRRLFPVINAAINVASSSPAGGLSDRRAYPATLTPLHLGYDRGGRTSDDRIPPGGYTSTVRARPADESAIHPRGAIGAMRLSRAMALSGAALNSGMGFYGSSLFAFALTLLNTRLGLWLTLASLVPDTPSNSPSPNPSKVRRKAAQLVRTARKKWSEMPNHRRFVQELLGRHGIDDDQVNVSDGGHFDNLGLYAMLRRECRWIIVVDGGGDDPTRRPDLARAIRLARIDLDVEIKIHGLSLDAGSTGPRPGVYKGRIKYPKADGVNPKVGTLVYICPEVSDRSPLDVRAYANANPKFPCESTGDQFFSEQQFESYRALGFSLVDQALELHALSKSIVGRSFDHAGMVVEALAESAVLIQQGGGFPTHAGLIVVRDTDRREVLMVTSSDNTSWVFPKGHIETGEDARTTALREFYEETGIAVELDPSELQPAFIDRFKVDGASIRCAYFIVVTDEQLESADTRVEARESVWVPLVVPVAAGSVEVRGLDDTRRTIELPTFAPAALARVERVLDRRGHARSGHAA